MGLQGSAQFVELLTIGLVIMTLVKHTIHDFGDSIVFVQKTSMIGNRDQLGQEQLFIVEMRLNLTLPRLSEIGDDLTLRS